MELLLIAVQHLCHNSGFDILLDSQLTPHLLEVNTKPQLLPYPLDSFVNKPMVWMIWLLHTSLVDSFSRCWRCSTLLATTSLTLLLIVSRAVKMSSSCFLILRLRHLKALMRDYTAGVRIENRGKRESQLKVWTFKHILFRKKEKAAAFLDGEQRLGFILKDLTPLDLRILIKSEEELSKSRSFSRIFPTPHTSHYLDLLSSPQIYADKLLDAYEQRYTGDR